MPKLDLIEEHRGSYQFTKPPYFGVEDHDLPLQVNACGHQQPRKMIIGCNRPHGLNDYLLIYLHKGSGVFQFSGVSNLVQSSSIIAFKPHEPQIIQYRPEHKSQVFWVHFTGTYDDALLKSCHLKAQVTTLSEPNETLAGLYLTLFNELLRKDINYELQCVSILLSIAAQISRAIDYTDFKTGSGKNRADSSIRNIVHLLDTRYGERWTVSNLAQICSLAPNYFIASFKKQTGFTPMEYLNHIRIRKADELLAYTNMSIQDIAHQSGFIDPLYFSRRYTESFGFPPSARRKYFEEPKKHEAENNTP